MTRIEEIEAVLKSLQNQDLPSEDKLDEMFMDKCGRIGHGIMCEFCGLNDKCKYKYGGQDVV